MAKKSLRPDEQICADVTAKMAADFASGADADFSGGEPRGIVNTFEIVKEYFDGDRKEMTKAFRFMDTPSDEIVGYFYGMKDADKVPVFPAGVIAVIDGDPEKKTKRGRTKMFSTSRFDTKQGPSIIVAKVWGPSGTSDFALFTDEHRGNGWNPIVFKNVRTDSKESLLEQFDKQLANDSRPQLSGFQGGSSVRDGERTER